MIDLHSHSTASDGTYTPTELIKSAIDIRVSHLALTDHDTTDGLGEFLQASESSITLIPGIELSVDFNIGELHIVGLFINKDCPAMVSLVADVKRYRMERNIKMVEKLSALVKKQVKIEDLLDNPNGQLGRPHIAKYLLKNNIVGTLQEAFNKYLTEGGIISAPKKRISIERAFKVIKESSGVVVLAHPSTLGLEDKALDTLVKKFKDQGLDAIEVFSSHSPDEKKESYLKIANKYDLAISCGSDFHGGNSKVAKLGADIGTFNGLDIINPLHDIALSRGYKY